MPALYRFFPLLQRGFDDRRARGRLRLVGKLTAVLGLRLLRWSNRSFWCGLIGAILRSGMNYPTHCHDLCGSQRPACRRV